VGFEGSCAPTSERIEDVASWACQGLDEERRQLRLKASPIGELMERISGALFRRPEFTGSNWYALTAFGRVFPKGKGPPMSKISQATEDGISRG
jgi:hypothetical protein|tara:strand:+ start:330 stop:611 length:282 start_codon:yes stop_codon:yes gene_type:complete